MKHFIVALASIALAGTACQQASAQVIIGKGNPANTFRGPTPGFNYSPVSIATNVQGSFPKAIYSVSAPGGIITPAAYLGNNLGQTLSTTYNGIVASNAILSLNSNSGQQGNFGNLGSQGAQGGQVGQVGNIGNAGNVGGNAGGVGGKAGAGGAIGAIGALGSRYYGI